MGRKVTVCGTAGGNVHLQAGNSGAPGGEGAVIIKDSLGVPRVTVTGAGDILMTPPSGTITSFASQAPIVTSATLHNLLFLLVPHEITVKFPIEIVVVVVIIVAVIVVVVVVFVVVTANSDT